MKLFLSGILFCALLAANVSPTLAVDTKQCPDTALLSGKCTCFEDIKYMVCRGLDETFLAAFNPTKMSALETLVIKNSPNLPRLADKFHSKTAGNPNGAGLTTKSLVLIINEDFEESTNGNIDGLLRLASEIVDISSTKTKLVLNANYLGKTIKSLSLTNVKLENFNKELLTTLDALHSIKFNNVDADLSNPLFDQTALTQIEISNCLSLDGAFTYSRSKTTPCTDGQKIYIDLRLNTKLTGFSLDNLFADKNCHYHIDLTGSKLSPDFLDKLSKVTITKNEQLYIILQDVTLNCCKSVLTWYTTRKNYVHGVQCMAQDGKLKYLSDMKDADMKPACT